MNIRLKSIPTPPLAFVDAPAPAVPTEEYVRRLQTLYEAAGADWVAVYADREHHANLTFLVNLDPRFEEAVLLLGPGGRRVLLLGNECMGYTSVLTVPVEPILCQSLSLGAQPRATTPRMKDVLAQVGVGAGHQVSVVGWKYLEPAETDEPTAPAFVPAFLVDVLRSLVGPGGRLVDGTALLMHPEHGIRSLNGCTAEGAAAQIAAFEWGARHASAAVFSVLRNARPGMSEMRALSHMHYAGLPLTMHPIFVSGKGEINGLRSPSAKIVEYGDGVSVGLGYWGSLVCRAGMMLGAPDETYFEQVVTPYFRAIATWHQTLRIGISGGRGVPGCTPGVRRQPAPARAQPRPPDLLRRMGAFADPAGQRREDPLRHGLPVRHHPDAAAAGAVDELRRHGGGGGRIPACGDSGLLSGVVGAHAAAPPVHPGSDRNSVGRRAAAAHRRHRLPAALLAGERAGLHPS